jgi:flagellar L-ring protein precursor FlgH
MRIALPFALAALACSCASTGEDVVTMHDTRAAAGAVFDAAQRGAVATYDAGRRIVGPPRLANVENPAPLAGEHPQSMPGTPISYGPAAANSLWRPGGRSFFNDQRASRMGDILTVEIEIRDKAELSNSSQRQRTGDTSAGVTNFFGLEHLPDEVLPGGFDPQNMVNAQADSSHSGQGTINREEKIQLTVAAVIVDILPNGNLVIAGRQEVRINAELRELTVSGVIRPEDIDARNTISHDQIAEARISYGGRGQISAVQRPNWGQRIADAVTPW